MRRYDLNDECKVPPDQAVMRETDGSCGDWVQYEDAKAEIDSVGSGIPGLWHETRKRLEGELKATQTERDSLANRVKELESEHRTPCIPIGDDWRDYRLRADHSIMVKARRDQYDMIWIAAEDGPWTIENHLFDLLFVLDVPCAAPAASTPTGPADNDRQDEPRTPAAPHERTVRVFTGRKEQHWETQKFASFRDEFFATTMTGHGWRENYPVAIALQEFEGWLRAGGHLKE